MASIIETAKSATIAYNEKNWASLKDVLAADTVYDEKATHRRVAGADAVIDLWKGWAAAFPDSKATFLRELSTGDMVVFEVVWKGTHKAPLPMPSGTIPASNKPIDLPACQVVQVKDGRVKSFAHYFDMATLLTQIGALKG